MGEHHTTVRIPLQKNLVLPCCMGGPTLWIRQMDIDQLSCFQLHMVNRMTAEIGNVLDNACGTVVEFFWRF